MTKIFDLKIRHLKMLGIVCISFMQIVGIILVHNLLIGYFCGQLNTPL